MVMSATHFYGEGMCCYHIVLSGKKLWAFDLLYSWRSPWSEYSSIALFSFSCAHAKVIWRSAL